MSRKEAARTRFVLNEEEENDSEVYRHTWREEQEAMRAVQEGRTRDAVRLMEGMDADAGRLSANENGHWKNLAVIDMALVARAAIAGGLPPETAYRISGYYIRKCDAAGEIRQCLLYRNRTIEELTARIAELREKPTASHYTEQCKDCVRKRYREKLSLSAIADALEIRPEYLSRLFHQETGVTFQEYVNRVRAEHAAQLLAWSDKSLPAIAEYVHFPSQSYFCKMFKRFYGVTPRAYRERFLSGEFHGE